MDQKPCTFEALQEQEELWIGQDENESPQHLPPYDEARGTRRVLLVFFIFSLLLSTAGLVIGIYAQTVGLNCHNPHLKEYLDWEELFYLESTACNSFGVSSGSLSKLYTLLFTIAILVCTECLGYIHSITLRWALAKEGRLGFNSNLRLFSSARSSYGNGLWANIFSTLCLILCYAGATCALLENQNPAFDNESYVPPANPSIWLYAIGVIGASAGLLGLCIITGIGWLVGEKKNNIKSWNPHPLNTTLVCLHHNLLSRNMGRANLDASQRHTLYQSPHELRVRQPSALQTAPILKHIKRFAIAISCITLGLTGASLIGVWRYRLAVLRGGSFRWLFFPVYLDAYEIMFTSLMNIQFEEWIPPSALVYMPLIWSFFWQSISTLTFHIMELLVNLRRDEACWRKAASPKPGPTSQGASFSRNAFLAAFTNKGSITLFCLKPLGQWIYTLGVYSALPAYVGVNPLPLVVLSVLIGMMGITTVIVAHHHPKGPLPSTYGHLQTIADIVDNWGQGAEGKLYWGDMGPIAMECGNETVVCRRTGTSGDKEDVGEVVPGAEYSIY